MFDPLPTVSNCTQIWMEQPVDHFNHMLPATWRQRVYVYDGFLQPPSDGPADTPAPIFFYAGNEGAVPKAVNTTGLMWELGSRLGALLVWGEHRYYGESLPLEGEPDNATAHQYLSVEQALADYAELVQWVKDGYGLPVSPVVAFGGSYGGELAAWLRLKFPNVFYAAVASSAPLRCQLVDRQGWDGTAFWDTVTHTASPAAGASADCVPNVRAAFAALFDLSATPEGRATVAQQLAVCDGALESEADAEQLATFLRNAFDTAAMGSSPIPSYYFAGDPLHPLPAWPMRVVCREMEGELSTSEELLGALRRATAVVLNVSGTVDCYSRDVIYEGAWQTGSSYAYQVCTEWVPNESFFPSNASSMFWDQRRTDIVPAEVDAFCADYFGCRGGGSSSAKSGGSGGGSNSMSRSSDSSDTDSSSSSSSSSNASTGGSVPCPRPDFGLLPLLFSAGDLSAASNVVLYNGLLDPWSAGGYLANVSESVVAVVDPNGGHHADLSWSTEADPPSLTAARQAEAQLLVDWLAAYTGRAVS